MKKKAQPQPEAPQAEQQDLDLEIVSLRRGVAECEVSKNRLEMENGDLIRDLKQAKVALDLGDRRIADLEAFAETLVVSLKERADEADGIRLRLEKSEASAAGLREQLDTTVSTLTKGWGR